LVTITKPSSKIPCCSPAALWWWPPSSSFLRTAATALSPSVAQLADRCREGLDRGLRGLRVAALERRLRAAQLHAAVGVRRGEDRAAEVLLRALQGQDPVGQALVGRDELGGRRRAGRLGGGGLRRECDGRQQGDHG
jgi:hypothetical protein